MTLTEVVFKIKNQAYAPCEFTEQHHDVKQIINQTSWDPTTRTSRAIITLSGPDEKLQAFARVLLSLHDEAEILSAGNQRMVLRVVTSLDTLRKTGNPRAFALEYFGDRCILTPGLLYEGFLHTRLLAPDHVDVAAMLQEYERGVQGGRWSDFRLVRIDNFDPEQQVAGAFAENLTPKQLEVIKTALALGFYNTPRDVTLDDLSNIFGISKAAVHNRLQAAERKVIARFFS
jgi:hypothetical protein